MGRPRTSQEKVAASIADAIKNLPERMIARRENKKGIQRRGVVGRHSGENVMPYVHKMFVANESRPQNERWTNTHIKEAMLVEFAHFPDTIRFLTDKRRDPINYYRHKYNKGRLSDKLSPTVLSVRYDVQGFAVRAKNVEHRLTRADYLLALYQYDMNVVYVDLTRTYEVIDDDYSFFNLALWESLEV